MMAAALRNQVVAAYRSLLQAQRVLFSQDLQRLKEAKIFTRSKFEQNKLEKDETKITDMLKVATDSKKYIDSHVIQAQVNNKGRYEMKIRDTTHTTQDKTPTFSF